MVRQALEADISAMHQLILELAEYEKAPDEVIATESTLRQALFSERPVAMAWVAEVDGVIGGMAICYLRYSTWKGITLYLEDLVVQEQYRKQGIGSALIDACIAHAKGQQYKRIVWQVLDWNTPAIEFYKKYPTKFDAGWLNAWIDL